MPRYFFHVEGDAPSHDHEGSEMLSSQVREEAEVSAREIMAEGDLSGIDKRGDSFNVVDKDGETVLTFPFSEALAKA